MFFFNTDVFLYNKFYFNDFFLIQLKTVIEYQNYSIDTFNNFLGGS